MAEKAVEEARLRRQRLLRRGMENMGVASPLRQATPPESKSPQPNPSPEEVGEPTKDQLSSASESQLADAIEKRLSDVKAGKDYFSLLGVSRESNREAIKAAFLQLAKVFHPDRLPSSLQHLSKKITTVFEAIREAYETLLNDAKRQAYLKRLEETSKPVQKADRAQTEAEAQEAFKKGENLLKKKDFFGAAEAFKRANDLAPNPVYLAATGWAIYMDPDRRSETSRAKQMIADALKADPECARAHYQLGVIARVDGQVEKAEKHFRRVLEADPKHLEARQELHVLQSRKKKGFSFRLK